MNWARGLRARASKPVARALLLGLAVSIGITVLSRLGVYAGWEARAIDAFLFFRERVPAPAVVVVAIDEDTFQALGERQPLDRQFLADLADFLLKSGARVVAFDVQLSRASTPLDDAALVGMTRRWEPGRVAFASLARPRGEAGRERYEASAAFSPALRATPGFANAPIGDDGVIRRMMPVLPSVDGGYLPSLALAALAGAGGYAPERLAAALHDGGAPLALPVADTAGRLDRVEPVTVDTLAHAPWRIDFAGRPGSVTTFPAMPLVQMGRTGVTPAADNPFAGKIVFVGATFAESRDFYPTPMGLMPGVEIQANMLHTLLARRVLLPPNPVLNLGLLAGVCVASALLSVWLRPFWATAATLVVIALFAVASYEAYTRGGYWLDFVGPMAAMRAYLQLSKKLAQRRVQRAFGQYVSPEVMRRVVREGADLGGEVRTVSVLMSDVRGFTTLSERMSPAEITEIMNEYFAAMVEVVMARHGMVNDFIGDGLLAVFSAPVDDPEHAWHAVSTALAMQEALVRLNRGWEARGAATLAMGVAVNTGEVFAGNMGSPKKKKYTVMGDPVNTVARMEGLNRDLGTSILISAPTLAAVKGRVTVRDRGGVIVKGKTQAVEIFELLGAREASTEDARS
ncbi:MAG TPA: adenylate/guanylate cyclase domain-containing protein [Candidatus Acidoferrum sp.]|nr:adenylate/guanylate cyclase domain-containing protein [Candidatus Acidoferrum sp.]